MNVAGGWLFLYAGQPLHSRHHVSAGPKSKGCFPVRPACVGIGTDSCTAMRLKPVTKTHDSHKRQTSGFAKAPPRFVVTEPKPTIDDAPRLSGFKHGSYHEMSLDFTRIFSLRCFIHSMF